MATLLRAIFVWIIACSLILESSHAADDKTIRVFIFAGQSNMVGSDSKAKDIRRFPPFLGLEAPQERVRFSYCIGREEKRRSDEWTALAPVNNVVGPELSFARKVGRHIKAPIAIIKCAAGGTHLGGDWNPEDPSGFKMYPLALSWVKSSLAELKRQGLAYRVEGFMWHQGENDMFNDEYRANYGKNLEGFIACWRRDLETPELKFYVGELCTKTIWGMDLRPSMYAISVGQRSVTAADPNAEYVPTSHVGVEIGGGVGLHYHYGTLGQLEHGENYADAYLRTIGKSTVRKRPLKRWPYRKGSPVKLFVLAGHRNMEGERAFVQDLKGLRGYSSLGRDTAKIAFKYSLGGGCKTSDGWEPLGPAGPYDNFGPELSLGRSLKKKLKANIAIAKFTHSGSQIIDWTPEGSEAKSRNLFPQLMAFVAESIQELEEKGHTVELAGVFYHVGENDMSFGPYRREAPKRLRSIVQKSREVLARPDLRWFMSEQPPTDDEAVNAIDVSSAIAKLAEEDENWIHFRVADLPPQEQKLVITTAGIVKLGERIAKLYLDHEKRSKKKR